VQRQSNLFEIVLALRPAGGFTRLLHRRQQERDQDRDNGDHHEQFNQSKSSSAATCASGTHGMSFRYEQSCDGPPWNFGAIIRRATTYRKIIR
jgi:hypothetical protein